MQLEKNHVVPTAWQDEALARPNGQGPKRGGSQAAPREPKAACQHGKVTDSMDRGLSKLQEMVKDREAWNTAVRARLVLGLSIGCRNLRTLLRAK